MLLVLNESGRFKGGDGGKKMKERLERRGNGSCQRRQKKDRGESQMRKGKNTETLKKDGQEVRGKQRRRHKSVI